MVVQTFASLTQSLVVAQREIEKAMASTNLILPKSNFEALVREIMHNVSTKNQDMPLRCAKDAFEALQEVAEAYIVSVFQCKLLLSTANCVTCRR